MTYDSKVQSWRATLHSEHITKLQVGNAFKLTSWKHFDAEIRDKILKFLTKKKSSMLKLKGLFQIRSLTGTHTHIAILERLRGTKTFQRRYTMRLLNAILCGKL